MALGYRGRLYILAFDHRGSFKKVFGFSGAVSGEQRERLSDGKALIFEGFARALARGAPSDAAGILVDEEFGADLLRRARKEDLIFAAPVEKSGQDEFDFEYGEEFGKHIEELDPTFAKVLVRYNTGGDKGMNARQAARLRRLSGWLHERGRKFLFELLVPPEESQLASVEGKADRYDREVRPGLMVETIAELQTAGVEPDVWKIEGIDALEDCERIAAQTRSGGRDEVACVVLGRGADAAAVEHWLRTGAGVPGYVGFAIGRTIWHGPLKGFLDGSLDRDAAVDRAAENFLRFVRVYEDAAGG